MLLEEYGETRKHSTLTGYFTTFTSMVRWVYGLLEFKAGMSVKHFPAHVPVISAADFDKILDVYQQSPSEQLALIGFFFYLLFQTAERNESVRTVEFSQFSTKNNIYFVHLFSSKTQRASKYELVVDAYNFVMEV